MDTDFELQNELRERRLGLNLKQWQVAERARLNAKRYQEYESGNHPMTLRTLAKIARALGARVTIAEVQHE